MNEVAAFNEEIPIAKAEQEIEPSGHFKLRGNFMSLGEPFTEDGVEYEAWQPANSDAPRVLVVEAYRDGLRIGRAEAPMIYENRWGVDVADMNTFEQTTETFIEEIKAGA